MLGCLLQLSHGRDTSSSIEGSVRVYNSGAVVSGYTQRFIASFAVNLNIRDYPFDVQVPHSDTTAAEPRRRMRPLYAERKSVVRT